MMNGYDAYVKYLALKKHFTPGSDYDYHKYQGKVRVKPETYENQGGKKFLFERLGRHKDPIRLMVANFLENPKLWVADLFDEDAEENYNRHVKVCEALSYTMRREISQFEPWMSFNDLVTFDASEDFPPLLMGLVDGNVSPEVVTVLDELCGFTRHWEKYDWNPVIRIEAQRIRKLRGFIEYSPDLVKETVKKLFLRGDQEATAT